MTINFDTPANGKLSREDVAALKQQFRAARAEHGFVTTDTDFFAPAVHEWMDAIENGGTLTTDAAARIFAGTRVTLSMRDAMLVAVLSDADEAGTMEIAGNPHDSKSVGRVFDALNKVFRDPSALPDTTKCGNALDAIADLLGNATEACDAAHLHAVTAYIKWWLGDIDAAGKDAARALETDNGCNLAQIIMTFHEFDVTPAWRTTMGV